MLRRAAPVGLELLELHYVVDPTVEEGGRFGPALAFVVEPNQQGRAVDRTERYPLSVMVEVGARVASDAPHEIGAAPRNTRGQRQVLGHGEDREATADCFTRGSHDLEPAPDEAADLLSDLEFL